jgi:hypothetical protein
MPQLVSKAEVYLAVNPGTALMGHGGILLGQRILLSNHVRRETSAVSSAVKTDLHEP